MWKKITSMAARRRSTSTVVKYKDLRAATRDQIEAFGENLRLLTGIKDCDKATLLARLVDSFHATFDMVQNEFFMVSEIQTVLFGYCDACGKFGSLLIKDIAVSKQMFETLFMIYHIYSFLPNEQSFVELFSGLHQAAKSRKEVLEPAYDIFTILFKSREFFNGFMNLDGYTLVFTSFFLHDVSKNVCDMFINLLFDVVPKSFHEKESSDMILPLFVETLATEDRSEDFPFGSCVEFITRYLAAKAYVDEDIFGKFAELSGFVLLNRFVLAYCQDMVCPCYQAMLSVDVGSEDVIQGFLLLYTNDKTSLSLRTEMFRFLSGVILDNIALDKFVEAVPIKSWILPPPFLDREALILIAVFLKNLSETRKMSIKPCLDPVLQWIIPPGNEEAPIDSFLEMIETAIKQNELKPEELLERKFLEDFILIPTVEQVADYFEKHVLFGQVVATVYSAKEAEDYRFPVIQKFIHASEFLSNMTDFVSFLESLFKLHFSAQIVSLLLHFINNKYLAQLLTKELTMRPKGFTFFLESNGFIAFDEYLQSDAKDMNVLWELIASLSHFGPKKALNKWINEQPANSPLFKCDRMLLAKAVYAFKSSTNILHIPALLPCISDFDASVATNVYLAGRYGVPSYRKFGMNPSTIPHIHKIINRYIEPRYVPELLRKPENIEKYVDVNQEQFGLFEFLPNMKRCSVRLQMRNIAAVSCFFYVTKGQNYSIPFLTCNEFEISLSDKRFVVNSGQQMSAVEFAEDKWNHVFVNIHVKPARKVTIYLNRSEVASFKHEELIPRFVFGNDQSPLNHGFLLSRAILCSDKPITDVSEMTALEPGKLDVPGFHMPMIGLSQRVIDVKYMGFASYFKTMVQMEELFSILESSKNIDQFCSMLRALLLVQKVNETPIGQFWNRLMLAMKRCSELIAERLVDVIYTIPTTFYDVNTRTKYLEHLLLDIEIFFVMQKDCMLALLKMIAQDLETEYNLEMVNHAKLSSSLCLFMRAGLDDSIAVSLIPILSALIMARPTVSKLRFLMNTSIAACDWDSEVPMSLTDYPVHELLGKDLPETVLHLRLLHAFTDLAKRCSDTELYTYQQLLGFMLLFDDERSFMIADLIAVYSNKNPKYVKETSLASFAFAQQCESVGCWIRAFAILAGQVAYDIFPTKLIIARPDFLPVIINMLSSLCRKNAAAILIHKEPPTSKLLPQLMDILITTDDFSPFLSSSCQVPLAMLSNYGLVPKSMVDESGERIECNWATFESTRLSKEDLKTAFLLCDKVPPFTQIMHECKELANAQTFPKYFQQIEALPRDTDDLEWVTGLGISTPMTSLFASIIFAAKPQDFAGLLSDLVFGNSLMYSKYSLFFGQEIIFTTLIRLATTEVQLDMYHKPTFSILSKAVKVGLFTDTYVHLLSLVFNLLKTLELTDQFTVMLSDPIVMNAYRDILVGAFVFVKSEGVADLFQLFNTFKSVFFYQPVFVGKEKLWIHLIKTFGVDSPDLIVCLTSFMSMFDDSMALTEYKAEEMDGVWKQCQAKFTKKLENTEVNNRVKRGKNIINAIQHQFSAASLEHLALSIFRVANLYIQSNLQVFGINVMQREIEKTMYSMKRTELIFRRQRNIDGNAYHLSASSMPMYESRALCPSLSPLKSPEFGKTCSNDFFANESEIAQPCVVQFQKEGKLCCSPEWFPMHSKDFFSSPFSESYYIEQSPSQLLYQYYRTFAEYGNQVAVFSAKLLFFTHPIPCTVFVTDRTIQILVLSEYDGKDLSLMAQPERPIAFLPLTEAALLGEFSNTSLFCGHLVLIFDLDRLMKIRHHLHIHRKVSLSMFFMNDPNIICIFHNASDCDACEKAINKGSSKLYLKQLPNFPFIFSVNSVQQAQNLWISGLLSNYDYLLLLNVFGGRSFMDLAQYPVFPWVVSPVTLEPRDLTKPMGQLAPERAEHYDVTYESSAPNHYYYGFHYSLPGAVFWLMMRLPPFTYFQWDLNQGWDDSQRLFVSVSDAWSSASTANPSDLKELIPEIFSIPELLRNESKLTFLESINETVALPSWANDNCHKFVDVIRKHLENCGVLNEWIDLIFGYKEVGEEAILAKNVFFPASYHDATAESLDMDPAAFETQVSNFGQCPVQVFTKVHPPRHFKQRVPIALLESAMAFSTPSLTGKASYEKVAICDYSAYFLPKLGVAIPPRFFHFLSILDESLCITEVTSMQIMYRKSAPFFAFAKDVAVSHDGLFAAVSCANGKVYVYRIICKSKKPRDLEEISEFDGQFQCKCSALLSCDFMCASVFGEKIVLWNFITQMRHREISIGMPVTGLFFDSLNGLLTAYGGTSIKQFSINGEAIRELTTERTVEVCGLLPYASTFDGRVLVIGDHIGFISFYSVSEDDYGFKEITKKMVHKHKIESLFIDPAMFRMVTKDIHGNVFLTTVNVFTNEANIIRCSLCENPSVITCNKCKIPLCESCATEGLCPSCATEIDQQL